MAETSAAAPPLQPNLSPSTVPPPAVNTGTTSAVTSSFPSTTSNVAAASSPTTKLAGSAGPSSVTTTSLAPIDKSSPATPTQASSPAPVAVAGPSASLQGAQPSLPALSTPLGTTGSATLPSAQAGSMAVGEVHPGVPSPPNGGAGSGLGSAVGPLATTAPGPAAPPPPSMPLQTLSGLSPSDAQRLGLSHLQGMGPGSSYSSPLQAFRPPTHVSQPLASAPVSPAASASAAASPAPTSASQPSSQSSTPPQSSKPAPAPNTSASKAGKTSLPSASTAGGKAAPAGSSKAAPTAAKQAATPAANPPVAPSSSASATSTTPTASGPLVPAAPSRAGPSSASSYAASDAARAIPTNKNNPAFLNKLRSMVDDPNTDELIRWSHDGASFFVPNHVRFGDEVLPRFFKHNRFSSFVRQLNMYGFHKVPHLQQGALKHDSPTESELWEFSNPNFHRDHPEWLSRVQRKKGVRDTSGGSGDAEKEKEPMSNELTHPASMLKADFGLGALEGEQGALQLTSVLNAINAIKTAQNSITTDLRHLQTSNQSLWQEAIESRQRAKRQQETINKILRFLAGVFGAQDGEDGAGGGMGGGAGKNAAAVSAKARGKHGVGNMRPARQGRLMIEDGRGTGGFGDIGEVELPDADDSIEELPAAMRFTTEDSPQGASPPQSNSSSRFTALGSPPRTNASLPDFAAEGTSTPGGSRRLSSQAGNSILNALASGEGSAWLANLFGAGNTGQGASSTASTPGGGFKLDPQMVAALQQAIASGTSATDQDYFAGAGAGSNGKGKGTADDASRFSFASPPFQSPPTSSSSSTAKGRGSSKASKPKASSKSNGAQSKAPVSNADNDALAKIASMSQALVHSPSRAHAKIASAGGNGSKGSTPSALQMAFPQSSSDSMFGPIDASGNQQVGMPLNRVSRDIQSTAADVDQVQSSINSLVESLKLDPSMLQSLTGVGPAPAPANGAGYRAAGPANVPASQQNLGNVNAGMGSNGARGWVQPAPSAPAPAVDQAFHGLNLPDASQPPSAYASSAIDGNIPLGQIGSTSGATGGDSGALAMDADFDVDSFLNQFVDPSQAPGQSPAAFHAGGSTPPSGNVNGHDSSIFDSGLGLGGMMDDGDQIGTSPSFAFSPGTTAAFLRGDSDVGGGGGGGGGGDVFGNLGSMTGTATQSTSTTSSAHSTPVVGSWGIEHPAASVASGGHSTPMSVSTPPPPNRSQNASPAVSLAGGSGGGGGSSAKKRKTTTVETATDTDIEMAAAGRSGKKTRKSLSPSSSRKTSAP